MSDRSAIEWTEATWNPVTGCSKVSPGCAHCYAETISLRFGWSQKPWTPENATENVILHPERLDQPLRWRKPRTVFVNSMSDMFHERVPRDFLDRIFAVMALAGQHKFQVLTKRPEVARDYFMAGRTQQRIAGRCYDFNVYNRIGTEITRGDAWPLPNVWLGVSIENARYTWRADVLREIPAAVRFISAEPLIGSLLVTGEKLPGVNATMARAPLDLTGINWLIVGGESGPGFRPLNLDHARELRDACQVAGVAYFFKQVGGSKPKSGGRLLDGREWNEMPGNRGYEEGGKQCPTE